MYCGPREREPYPLWHPHQLPLSNGCPALLVGTLGFFDVYRVKADRHQCLDHGALIFTYNAEAHFLSKTWFPDHQGFIKDHSQRHQFANKGLYSQSYGFPSSRVWVLELYHKEGWALKKWCFWTMVLEKTLESPLECKEINPVNPKGNQSWIFTGRTNTETEAPILWPPDVKSWLIRKDPDAGKGWRQEEKGTAEDEMVEWHHQFDGHEFEQTLQDSEIQGSLVCCNP